MPLKEGVRPRGRLEMPLGTMVQPRPVRVPARFGKSVSNDFFVNFFRFVSVSRVCFHFSVVLLFERSVRKTVVIN